MKVEWVKSRKEVTPEKIAEATKYCKNAKIQLRKGKSGHQKAKKLAENR